MLIPTLNHVTFNFHTTYPHADKMSTEHKRASTIYIYYTLRSSQGVPNFIMLLHGSFWAKNAIPTYGNYQLLLCYCLLKVYT